ncbi:MAG: metal-dependent hydrolase [Rhodopirellula sp.]|jgi:L-ascorbate metabolism protein UlaG (beta-lactamase superfamily)|nr:metal-dependent hydrolase [Rhodopirellula sp.]|tara:strand:+ start:150 stop:836 length:687 start_codon:yes stop_codon:yes gene_type:complete
MATSIKWLGHYAFEIRTGDQTVLVDPFVNDNPVATVSADDLEADFILVTHGHADHVADVASIANRTGATVIAPVEAATWFQSQQNVENTIQLNLGGGIQLPFGHVRMTIAHHSSSMPDGSYGGNPAGYILTLAEGKVYFSGDTALFMEMELYGRQGIDLAILSMGDHFTMGPDDSVEAVKMLKPARVVPAHFNTWPPIEQDANAWADKVSSSTEAQPVVLDINGVIEL